MFLQWHSRTMGTVPAADFIPVAEQAGLMKQIGDFAMEHAIRHAAAWYQRVGDEFFICLNISPQQLRDPYLPARLVTLCDEHALPPGAIVVEITEDVLLSDQPQVADAMAALRSNGIRLAMDDFGTGYASLTHLREYRFDILKIDRSFIAHCVDNEHDRELVVASLQLATGLGIQVVAEGVESEAQMTLLQQHGCSLGQGYLFSQPVTADRMTELIEAEASR